MQLQDKDKAAYYASLSIFLGSLELFIPKPLPFFRLGLSNIPIVLSLEMPFPTFLAIALLKALGNSYISGSLFSFFGLISIAQALSSSLSMFGLKKLLRKHVSFYGISMFGALVSTIVQTILASLFLGSSIASLMPIMLLSSLLTSLLVAFFSYRIPVPQSIPRIDRDVDDNANVNVCVANLLLSGFSIMIIDSLLFAIISFVFALLFQYISGRKIKIVPYVVLLLLMILTSIITPIGKTIFKIGFISITQIAFENALKNAFVLSAAIALSQGYSQIIKPGKGILGETLAYFTSMMASFRDIKGKTLIEKARIVLSLDNLKQTSDRRKKTKPIILFLFSFVFLTLTVLSRTVHLH